MGKEGGWGKRWKGGGSKEAVMLSLSVSAGQRSDLGRMKMGVLSGMEGSS